MCDTKTEGGRRCPAHYSELSTSAHNARRRANRASRAAGANWARENLSEDAAAKIAAASPAAARQIAIDLGVPSHVVHPAAAVAPPPPVQRVAIASLSEYGFAAPTALRDNPDEDDLFDEGFTSSLWTEVLTGEQYAAVQDYTANAYDTVNGALKRGAADALPKEYRQIIENLDSALELASRPSKPRTLYRGARVPDEWSADQVRERISESFPVGSSVTYRNYLSTSLKPSVAEGFSRGEVSVVYEMMSRSGANLVEMSDFPDEHEVLIGRDTKWRVAGVTTTARAVKAGGDGFAPTNVVLIHLVEEDIAMGEAVGEAPGLGVYRKDFSASA